MTETTLPTGRLILRPFAETDFRSVHDYASDPEVVRYVSFGPNSEEQTREFIQRAMAPAETPRTKYDFAVTLKDSGRLFGGCGLYLKDERRQGFIGYVLHRRFWGQGYATELAGALVNFGFRSLGLHRITAFCDPANGASARVMEKIAMRREGLMRRDVWMKGAWRDTLYFAILADEWRASHA